MSDVHQTDPAKPRKRRRITIVGMALVLGALLLAVVLTDVDSQPAVKISSAEKIVDESGATVWHFNLKNTTENLIRLHLVVQCEKAEGGLLRTG